jgi:hypothetical protein
MLSWDIVLNKKHSMDIPALVWYFLVSTLPSSNVSVIEKLNVFVCSTRLAIFIYTI